jgi:hypothetical protein
MLYLLVRKLRPEIVVETGVARGFSSAYMLLAMHQNGRGHLYSIDLPAQQVAVEEDPARASHRYTLSDGQKQSQYEIGYIVPEYLKHRWTLLLEDARQALPELLNKLGTIDIFYHDSLHHVRAHEIRVRRSLAPSQRGRAAPVGRRALEQRLSRNLQGTRQEADDLPQFGHAAEIATHMLPAQVRPSQRGHVHGFRPKVSRAQ